MTRKPSLPGEILQALYMEPLGLTISDLAARLGISQRLLAGIINGSDAVSVDIAMRLSHAFGTTPESWLNAQMNLDIWKARQGQPAWQNVQVISRNAEHEDALY